MMIRPFVTKKIYLINGRAYFCLPPELAKIEERTEEAYTFRYNH